MRRGRARGVSLVELIVAVVIIGAAVAGTLSVMNVTTQRSADPLVRQQAQLIAEAYLEEILLKAFYDAESGTVCPAKEASRDLYDNVCDYNGLNDNTGARNQLGTLVSGLSGYNVAVTVTPNATDTTGAVTLGTLTNDYINGYIRVLRVDVVVTHDSFPGVSVPLTGYRTNYRCQSIVPPIPATDNQCRPL